MDSAHRHYIFEPSVRCSHPSASYQLTCSAELGEKEPQPLAKAASLRLAEVAVAVVVVVQATRTIELEAAQARSVVVVVVAAGAVVVVSATQTSGQILTSSATLHLHESTRPRSWPRAAPPGESNSQRAQVDAD